MACRLAAEHGDQLRLTFPDHSARAGKTSRLISGGGRERDLIRGLRVYVCVLGGRYVEVEAYLLVDHTE